MAEVSIVIPTRNRDEDVKELLFSILMQTTPPKEVIVVDDSDNYKTGDMVEQMRRQFFDKGIALKYRRGEGKGLAQARNMGAAQMTGTIYCGLDDDVILDKDYIREILKIYEEYPDAMGVQGYMRHLKRFSALSKATDKVLFRVYEEKDNCRVLPAGMTFPNPLTRVIKCQWFSGTNSSYRREVLKDFKWDENLKEYSLCEDMDISYRILKRYPGSLYITPHARLVHKASPVGRINTKHLIHMGVAYSTYFFYKNIEQTLSNKIVFFWGMFFNRFIGTLFAKKPASIPFLMGAYLNLFKNFDEIRNGNFISLKTFARTKKLRKDNLISPKCVQV